MFKSFFLISSILLAAIYHTQAQDNTGTIKYQTTISLGDIALENVPEELAAMIPKDTKSQSILYFTPKQSLYETIKQDEQKKEFTSSNQNSQISIKVVGGGGQEEEKTFVDIANKKIIEQKGLLGKIFLIADELEKSKWKMTGRQKTILDYPVQEAIAANEKDTIYAWFTTQITVSTGPMGIGGLPGMVLEASMGKRLAVVATEIALGLDVNDKIKEPTKGKKVTKAQFAKIAKEKEAEMEEQFKEQHQSKDGNDSHTRIRVISR